MLHLLTVYTRHLPDKRVFKGKTNEGFTFIYLGITYHRVYKSLFTNEGVPPLKSPIQVSF